MHLRVILQLQRSTFDMVWTHKNIRVVYTEFLHRTRTFLVLVRLWSRSTKERILAKSKNSKLQASDVDVK